MPQSLMTGRKPVPRQCANAGRGRLRSFPAWLAFALVPVLLAARGLALNQPVPELTAPDPDGTLHTLADYAGKATLILFWNPANARAKSALCEVASLAAGYQPMGMVTVVSGPSGRDEISAALSECKQRPAVLLDPGRRVFSDYQIIALPTLFIMTEDRILKFKAAGFGHEGIGQAQEILDTIFGRRAAEQAIAPTASPEALRKFAMAQSFIKFGLNAQAVSALESVTTKHPEFRPAWVALGYQRIAAGRVDDAGQCLRKAQALDRNATDVAAGMAWLAWKSGNPDEARNWSQRVSPGDPNRLLLEEVRP